MAEKSTRLLLPEEEIEGDRQGTVDFVFCRIGEPVSLMPAHSNSAFDLSNPPFQPLAVSERHRLLFLAHTEGFLVANTKDVIGLAKGVMGMDTCVQRASVVDVHIGRVSILALSGTNSMLAVAVGGEIHLFHVQSLLDKVHEPAISCSLRESGIVKDLKWQRRSEDSFIILSSHGLLCHGSSDLHLKDVMDNVDAVDWSVDGKSVAIARKDIVNILSSNFEEILGIPLSFQSWDVDSESEIKVDSIKWVRHDSIVIGCTQLKEDGDEEGYLVQVIVSGEHKFTEVSCKPIVFSFPDLFEGLSVDMLPTGVGPYFLAYYLDCWDVAITSNKKNIDQHISLLRWLDEDNRLEVVSLELGSDKYIPRIDLQDDGEDNLILGLAVDKSSLFEKIKIQNGTEFKELSPRCILFCITCDGKLTLNHAAWALDHSDKMGSSHGDNSVNEGFHTVSSAESELEVTTSRLTAGLDGAISDKMHISPDKHDIGGKMGSHGTLDGAEPCSQGPGMITSNYSRNSVLEELKMPSNAACFGTKSNDFKLTSGSLMVKRTGTGQFVGSGITAGSTFGSRTAQNILEVDGSNASVSSTVKGPEASRSFGSTINKGSSSMSPIVMPFRDDAVEEKHLLSSPGESNSAGIKNKVFFSPPSNPPVNFAPFSKSFGTLASSEKINKNGQASSIKSGYSESAPILHSSPVEASAKFPGSRQQRLANSSSSKPRQRLEIEPQFSKQFYNVKEMTKELDALLSYIECEGGFKDLCTIHLEQSLLALETGLDDLLEVLFVCKDEIENQRKEIQQLCSKRLEVSARQVYMEGIVKLASDHRYWAFWNSQKLSPEFEAKRLQISNLKQNLTNQILELERHFNILEINRLGEYNTTTSASWRTPTTSALSRPTQSLHSVYSTVNSQLAAAEQLSEYLSKQMTVLNISSPFSEKRNVTKELFESIGLAPKTDPIMSADLKSCKPLPYSFERFSLSSKTSLKEQSWNCTPTNVKAVELESARRKRDSLDESWVHFEPSRTTVKRNSTKEHVRSNLDIAFREAKEVFDSQVKDFDIAQKSGTSSRASSKAFDSQKKSYGITKGSSDEAASFLSKSTFSSSQFLDQSPSKGIQEKYSKKEIDAQSNPIFKWAKDPLDLRSEPSTSWSSTSSQVFQSDVTQASLFAAPSIFSNSSSNNDGRFGSPFLLNMGASSTLNNSSGAATKTTSASKPKSVSTPVKFSSTVSPLRTASAAILTQESSKKLTIPSSTSSESIAQATASSTSSHPSMIGSEQPTDTSQVSSVSDIFSTKTEVSLQQSFSNKLGTDNNTNDSKLQQSTSQIPAIGIAPPLTKESSPPEAESAMAMSSSIIMSTVNLDVNVSQEDEMEEEALDTNSMLKLESLGGFSLQSNPTTNAQKPNSLSSSFLHASAGSASPQLSWNVSAGQLFRPSSFNLPESHSLHLSQSTSSSSSTASLSGGFSGFGQPAQLGAGQQALGSFGQLRQLGTASPGFGFGLAAGNSGSFSNASSAFAGASSFSGGFASVATGGGFAGAATGGGFAGAATGAGFAGASSFSGENIGFGSTTGGFGGFSSFQGRSGFGSGNSSAGRPPPELLTQMRR